MQSRNLLSLANVLKNYSKQHVIALAAGMLTVPKFQANCYRLEMLIHLAVVNCSGKTKPTRQHIMNWLNRQLGDHVAMMEDPVEDVFVTNLVTRSGAFRILGGTWEMPDLSTNILLQCIENSGRAEQFKWLNSAFALLALSELVLDRAKLPRWYSEASLPNAAIVILPGMPIDQWGKRVTFTMADLKAAGIQPELLKSFIFDARDASALMQENHQESSLHSKPLLRFGDVFVLALPTAVAYAIRRYLVQCAYDANQLLALQDSYMGQVKKIAMRAMRGGSRHGVKQISLPQAFANCEGKHQNFVFQLGRRRFIHLCILTESFKKIVTDGLLGPTEFSDEEEDAIHYHLEELYAYISTSFEVHSGHTLMLFGHLGQGFSFSHPPKRDNWTFDVCRADSLEMLSQDSDHPLDKLVLLLEQRTEVTSNNLHLVNSGGLLNLYAFWKESEYCLRATEMPHDKNCVMQISTDYVFAFRQARRKATDFHCERSVLGKPVSVVRGNTNSLFTAVKEIPAYVSLPHREAGYLSFCLQHMETTVWLTVLPNEAAFATAYDLWEALQFLLFRVLQVVKPQFNIATKVVELLLDMRGITTAQAAKGDLALSTEMVVKLDRDLPIVKLVAGAGFLRHFSGVANAGEQKLLSRIIYALGLLSGQDDMSEADCDRDALSILGGHDAKILHSVEYYNPVEHLLAAATRSTFRLPQEYQGATIRSVFCWMPASDKKRLLDRDQSIQALNDAVTYLMKKISVRLQTFQRLLLIEELMRGIESVLKDRTRWRGTARAVGALYGGESATAIAGKVEYERAQANITLRALVEAAVCECPIVDGITPDGHAIDELFGLMWTLLELGRDSQMIYHGLASKWVTIYPSGAYDFKADSLEEMGKPFAIANWKASFDAAAADYEQWVQQKETQNENDRTGEFYSDGFSKAFSAEYHISPDIMQKIIGALYDVAIDTKSVVVVIDQVEIVRRCIASGVSAEMVAAFLKAFSLPARPTWAPQLPYAAPKDVEPWRFERRLSVMLRPLIECATVAGATNYVYGVGTLRDSIIYILDATITGKFEKDVFHSKEMRSYLGSRIDALGRGFTEDVATKLRVLGWQAKTEVKMSMLGAGKNPDLGDIDVLAWRQDGHVLAIECKRLKGARTIAEIARTCNRFAGNTGDLLHKHLRRVDWLEQNRDKWLNFVKMPPGTNIQLHCPLVTNVIVPFRYLKDLAFDPKKIWPFDEIEDCLRAKLLLNRKP